MDESQYLTSLFEKVWEALSARVELISMRQCDDFFSVSTSNRMTGENGFSNGMLTVRFWR